MKLRYRLLWAVTCMAGVYLLVAFLTFSKHDIGVKKIGKFREKFFKTFMAGAAGQTVNKLMESPEHYHGEVKDGDTHDGQKLPVRRSNTEERSKKTVETNDAGSIQQPVPEIPGQRIIPTTPEMRQMIEWLAAQMDQVPRKPPREMGDQLLQVLNKSEDTSGKKLPIWKKFHLQIRRHELYPAASDLPEQLTKHLAQEDIVNAVEKSGGTQLKLLFTLKDSTQAIFKPQRFPRNMSDTLPNLYYFDDFERHFSEIAAYHLDRVLGFRRAPPVVGRRVNISSDIQAYADKALNKTIFWSPGNHLCFYGTCIDYCMPTFSVCGDPYILEGSLTLLLPGGNMAPIGTFRSPWKGRFLWTKKRIWHNKPEYCETIKKQSLWNPKKRRLWDIMDLSVFDFLSGNLDRHELFQYKVFGNDSMPLHLDQGRGFGKPYHDELECLQPIIHCCMIRRTTLVKLLTFYHGPVSLADQMKAAMARDLVSPILLDKHYNALDRRVPIILHEVAKCVKQKGLFNVVQDDGY